MRLFYKSRRRNNLSISDTQWRGILETHPILSGFTPDEETRLRELSLRFLREKRFVGARDFHCGDSMRRVIAVQACLPVLNLGLEWYDEWRTLIVYPDQFVHRRLDIDEIGVAHEWDDIMSGESWERGPVIVSWADVEHSGLGLGYNVVIHEMAHKLDLKNDAVNGFPPLHRGMDRKAWTSAFSAAFAALNAALQQNRPAPIDSYAAEDPGEFFAVVSEYFFENPTVLKAHYAEVYRQLQVFYRQDPAARLGD